MADKRKRDYPNKDLPSTAISFDRDVLALLKSIADYDDRSLASLVRHACRHWLQSAEGRDLSRRAAIAERSLLNANIALLRDEKPEEPSTPEESKS